MMEICWLVEFSSMLLLLLCLQVVFLPHAAVCVCQFWFCVPVHLVESVGFCELYLRGCHAWIRNMHIMHCTLFTMHCNNTLLQYIVTIHYALHTWHYNAGVCCNASGLMDTLGLSTRDLGSASDADRGSGFKDHFASTRPRSGSELQCCAAWQCMRSSQAVQCA